LHHSTQLTVSLPLFWWLTCCKHLSNCNCWRPSLRPWFFHIRIFS
jgi:hypothetical protein